MSNKKQLKKQFGQNFTKLIESRCINVQALSRKVGVSKRSLYGYMAGEAIPNRTTREKLNEFFAQPPIEIPFLEGRDRK